MNTLSLVKTILTQQLNNVGTTITNTECDYYDEDKRLPQRSENLFPKASRKVCLFCFKKQTLVNIKSRGE